MIVPGMLLTVSCDKVNLPKSADQSGSPAPNANTASVQDWTKSVSWLFSPQASPAPLTDTKPPTVPNAPVAAATSAASLAFHPHPAQGAKEAAMKMYPQLGVKDSTFNKTFRDLYVEESQKNPELLTQADWPLILAHRTADILTPPAPTTAPSPVPLAPVVPARRVAESNSSWASPTPSSNPLDRGAYNQARSPYWWGPWIRTY